MNYRAEIDGLRALAVIPVILFHAGFESFSGGFIGVDVFFVISGYLITLLLLVDLDKDQFSLLGFYERRARRILPALFFVMFACIPFAWLWMAPAQMEDFALSLVAVSWFVSNFLFNAESDYFDLAAEEKPLLHTWSLAVEEQYYLLFPVFLLVVWRFGRKPAFWIITVLSVLSLLYSEWNWRHQPTSNFFLAPSRAWELLAGCLAAFVVHSHGVRANNLIALTGLASILVAIFIFDESTPIPSLYALLPVGGVVLLILYAGEGTWIARLLGSRILVGLGLISYSAYLWHQPLFAFARIQSIEPPGELLMAILSLVAIVLAAFSWKFIEQPFRDRTKFSRRSIFGASALGILVFTTLGTVGYSLNGFKDHLDSPEESVLQIETRLQDDIWVIGDSHARHLLPGLGNVTAGNVRNLTSSGCIPFRDVDRYDYRTGRGDCAKATNGHLDQIVAEDPKGLLLLASMGPVYLDGTAFKDKGLGRIKGLGVELISDDSLIDRWEVYETGLRNTLTELTQTKNLRVIFVVDIPELGIDFGCRSERKVFRTPLFEITDLRAQNLKSQCQVSRTEYDQRTTRYKHLVQSVVAEFPEVSIFDPTENFCTEEICMGYSEPAGYLYDDFDHLSESGSNFWSEKFADWMLENSE